MASGKRPVTLGIFGSGEASPALVCDSLNDQFAFGPEDSEGYFAPSEEYDLAVLLPAGGSITSKGVHSVWEWAVRCELPYRVLWDETGNDRTVDVLGHVDRPEDIDIVDDVGAALVDQLVKSEHGMLLVISENETFDEATAQVAAAALRAGLPAYDLARALLEVTWRHLPDHEPPGASALEDENDGQTALAIVPDGPDVVLSAQEIAVVVDAFTQAEELLDSIGEGLLARIADTRESLIHGRSLLAPKPEAPAEDGEPKKTRLEIFDPEKNAWVPAGRGRPPKGVQKRRVPA
ncbi:hypothetical protein [Actinacidiphila sp. ITFR-21]|uniref:hypothetical protein n=1 Tax=Actinacidiphila sp. ITFR-21 TaxID=3075199 RepID=UPI00288A7B2E|nr:hypothetical protein [Streptomyces sp. ITFR-21]WNI17606.1 hypothetical protein RLT57_20165 [Streptomyces sp. ITFR-21]WNI17746.1 hypothetical protein RLT57_20880 [Streptomyces sp. ITFR-21]